MIAQEVLAEVKGCTSGGFAARRTWIYFEILYFYMSIIVLILYLACKVKICGGGRSCFISESTKDYKELDKEEEDEKP